MVIFLLPFYLAGGTLQFAVQSKVEVLRECSHEKKTIFVKIFIDIFSSSIMGSKYVEEIADSEYDSSEHHSEMEDDRFALGSDFEHASDEDQDEHCSDGEEDAQLSTSEDDEMNEMEKKKRFIKQVDKFQHDLENTGVVYMSRVPPFMKPVKVKHLLSQFGEIGRIYLSAEGSSDSLFKVHSKAL